MFDHFPTNFALGMAHAVGLIPAGTKSKLIKIKSETIGEDAFDNMMMFYHQLIEFQQLAMGSAFDDSMIAFTGSVFNDDQVLALEVIHKSTPTYVLGFITNRLAVKITDATDKELVIASGLLMDIINREMDPEEKNKKLNSAKRLVLKKADD